MIAANQIRPCMTSSSSYHRYESGIETNSSPYPSHAKLLCAPGNNSTLSNGDDFSASKTLKRLDNFKLFQ